MKRALLLILIALFLVPSLAPTHAQDTKIKLVPFTDTVLGLQGVAPEGWKVLGNGLRQRGQSATDLSLLALQAAPAKADTIWNALLPQVGLKEVPKSTSTRKGALDWTLYEFTNEVQGIKIAFDIALAEKDGKTYIVYLQMAQDEAKTLTEAVFYPVVDALTPLVATKEATAYREEDVTFKNGDVATLAGTLTFPNGAGPHPAVILVTGSGPQDRDEDLSLGIKPFRLIADYLTRRGIAVLRYDDRGVGKSTGNFEKATTADFASDAAAAFDYLLTRKEIAPKQIGLLGHSEGGMVAAILVGQGQKPFAFIVSMAGPAAPIIDLMIKQNEKVLNTTVPKPSEAMIKLQIDFLKKAFPLAAKRDFEGIVALATEAAKAEYATLTEAERKEAGITSEDEYVKKAVDSLNTFKTDWWVYFLGYDPRPDWEKATMPVLAVYGGLDVQVDAEQNATALDAALKKAGNKDYKIVTLPDANHLMQAAKTGGVGEYATLKQEFTPDFLPTVGDWIVQHVTVAN
jgi:hypothetical protein